MNRTVKTLGIFLIGMLTFLVGAAENSTKSLVGTCWRRHLSPEEINLSADNVSPSFKAYMELAFNEGNKAMLTIRIEGMGTKPAESKEEIYYECNGNDEVIIITKRDGGVEDREKAAISWMDETMKLVTEGEEQIFKLIRKK
ncbi:hypothetical protein [Porphyromonas gulae]|uniref:hypothetical protein n=1 Tax=Porphyromonas gulae TaxID=111105 RepID=UPI00051DB595|nr:hypothetical protein [Porphyromonas gulae]KGL48884.1 hypothetical protein HQ49_03525 [Porphyromonas gulae]